MNWVGVEDQIQLAYIFKTLVKRFDKHLNEIEDSEFGLARVNTEHKIECRIVTVNKFAVGGSVVNKEWAWILQEVANAILAFRNQRESFFDDLLLLIFSLQIKQLQNV